ncbi:hypothetical protein VP01_1030g2 [Puccinia sorghi]|uniref:Uncharacterized protein n=1 Tax=Puccinia sorghi TaxID=27349 RepID=A0A0L6VUK5_9BASI|nr:hypothetical protein VP01_1030g2 [Puccinia sorghi]
MTLLLMIVTGGKFPPQNWLIYTMGFFILMLPITSQITSIIYMILLENFLYIFFHFYYYFENINQFHILLLLCARKFNKFLQSINFILPNNQSEIFGSQLIYYTSGGPCIFSFDIKLVKPKFLEENTKLFLFDLISYFSHVINDLERIENESNFLRNSQSYYKISFQIMEYLFIMWIFEKYFHSDIFIYSYIFLIFDESIFLQTSYQHSQSLWKTICRKQKWIIWKQLIMIFKVIKPLHLIPILVVGHLFLLVTEDLKISFSLLKTLIQQLNTIRFGVKQKSHILFFYTYEKTYFINYSFGDGNSICTDFPSKIDFTKFPQNVQNIAHGRCYVFCRSRETCLIAYLLTIYTNSQQVIDFVFIYVLWVLDGQRSFFQASDPFFFLMKECHYLLTGDFIQNQIFEFQNLVAILFTVAFYDELSSLNSARLSCSTYMLSQHPTEPSLNFRVTLSVVSRFISEFFQFSILSHGSMPRIEKVCYIKVWRIEKMNPPIVSILYFGVLDALGTPQSHCG